MICLQTPSFGWSFQDGRRLASKPDHHKQRVARSSPIFQISRYSGLSRCCARIIFQRDSLKVNVQFKVNEVKIHFPSIIQHCYSVGLGSLVPIEQLYPSLFTLSGVYFYQVSGYQLRTGSTNKFPLFDPFIVSVFCPACADKSGDFSPFHSIVHVHPPPTDSLRASASFTDRL